MHNAFTILILSDQLLKCFCHPWLTYAFPSLTEVCPRAPCLKEAAVENLQQLLVFIQTVEQNAHIKELKKYHLQLQQVCNVKVW